MLLMLPLLRLLLVRVRLCAGTAAGSDSHLYFISNGIRRERDHGRSRWRCIVEEFMINSPAGPMVAPRTIRQSKAIKALQLQEHASIVLEQTQENKGSSFQ